MQDRFASLSDPITLPTSLARPVVAMGNFDGVHLGHRALIHEAVRLAAEKETAPLVLTFEPHTRAFFRPEEPMFRLTSPDLKAEAMAVCGAKGAISLTFGAELAAMSAEDFVRRLLVERYSVSGVVIGENFRFGKAKGGSSSSLVSQGEKHGFAVSIVRAVEREGVSVSSTRIRQALSEGDVAFANRMLGREWVIRAVVAHGDKRGRLLDYPTANLILPPGTDLKYGIYAVRATVDGITHHAVASFGSRPTFDNGAPRLEVHLFDFAGDLYGKTMDVSLVGYIRPELKFDGVEPLIQQMNKDSGTAREMLKSA